MDTIYLDTCALNRLTDDLSQPRIRAEADAVSRILNLVFAGQLSWIASTVLHYEIQRNPHHVRRIASLRVLSQTSRLVAPTSATLQRALHYAHHGLGPEDALHLAVSQQAEVDFLITTDDAFLKRARTRLGISRPELVNPVDWLHRRQPWLLPNPPSSVT